MSIALDHATLFIFWHNQNHKFVVHHKQQTTACFGHKNCLVLCLLCCQRLFMSFAFSAITLWHCSCSAFAPSTWTLRSLTNQPTTLCSLCACVCSIVCHHNNATQQRNATDACNRSLVVFCCLIVLTKKHTKKRRKL